LSELYKAYLEKRPSNLAPLDIQFVDFAFWQRQYLQGDVLNNKIDYWKRKLEDVSPLQIPTDYPRPLAPTSKGTSMDFQIDAKLSSDLKQQFELASCGPTSELITSDLRQYLAV
jgi:hypothetical protein